MSEQTKNESVFHNLAQTYNLSAIDLKATIEEESPGSLEEEQLGKRYRDIDELGQGGFGVIREVLDNDLRRRVALKRIRKDRMDDRAVRALTEEAQITAQLEHPNIVGVRELGVDEFGSPYFTMTRLYGISLEEWLIEFPNAPIQQLLRIFLKVGYAVAFAHSKGVIHRDIKPSNVFMGTFGEVRLIDWGLAKVIASSQSVEWEQHDTEWSPVELSHTHMETLHGYALGTPGFMSPEQATGRGNLDYRADIYTLGALLFYMFSHEIPVDVSDIPKALAYTRQGRIKSLDKLVELPSPLLAIIKKSMRTDRKERYQQVTEMLEDVENFLDGRRVQAYKETAAERFKRKYMGDVANQGSLSMFHLDFLGLSGLFFGVGIGVFAHQWLTGFGWLMVTAGLLAALPWVSALRRPRKPEVDPGSMLYTSESLREPVPNSRPEPTGKAKLPPRKPG